MIRYSTYSKTYSKTHHEHHDTILQRDYSSDEKNIITTEPASRFISVLCQSSSSAEIAATRALLLTKLVASPNS